MADTQLIKDRIDIVQLIQEYVPLKKAGSNWKGRCPFHHEKTPSFMVHHEKQIWHCFGCSQGGDIFSFIQRMENLEFIEALKLLAERAGVKIDTYQSEINQSQRNRILQITAAGATFFHRFLTELKEGAATRDYLTRRGLTPATLAQWQIGYAPDQWDLLTRYLLKKGYGIEDLVGSGLTIKREGADARSGRGYYDRFRGRVMFPLADAQGTVVGFTGRLLHENPDAGGKYINTPETMVYNKSRLLFGLPQAKAEIKKQDLAIVVEGQMDVVSSHQHGLSNVVAASGTALTPEQVRLLKRYTANLAIAFDADAAGESAGWRGVRVALAEGLAVKVIQIPQAVGKDADECLQKNPAAWFAVVAGAQSAMGWFLERQRAKIVLTDPRAKQQAIEVLLAELINIPAVVERDEWLKKIGEAFVVDNGLLREELRRVARRPAGNGAPTVSPAPASTPAIAALLNPAERLATEFWSLLIKFPALFGALAGQLRPEYFSGTSWSRLYELCQNLYTTLGHVELSALRQAYDTAEQENLIDVLELRPYRDVAELSGERARDEAIQILGRLRELFRQQRRMELQQAIADAEGKGDHDRVRTLLQELQLV